MPRLGLRGKLAIVLSAIVLASFGLVYVAASSLVTSMLMDQEIRALVGSTDVLSSLILRLAHNQEELDDSLRLVGGYSRLEEVQVLDENLQTVAPRSGTPAEVLVGRQRLQELIARDGPAALVRSPSRGRLFAALRPLSGGGYLFAARSAAPFLERKRTIVFLLVIWGAVVMFAVLAAGAILLRSVVTRPIGRLVEEAGEIATGGRELASAHLESDEFGTLRRSLTGMARRLQEDRRRIERQVEELSEMNRRLREAHEQLIRTEKLASVGQLAAGVAHEIGNPIGVILGYVEMLEDASLDDDSRADFVRQIRTATERIQTTIRDLLDFSRPAADEEATSNAAREAHNIIQFVAPQKRFRNIDIQLDHDPEASPICAMPPSRFKQVLINLLFNAADAMGGKGRIRVALRPRDGQLEVRIADSGPGIPTDILLRIFDPFFTTKDVGKGTGLGLFVCHTLVTRYGGSIQVENAAEGGALFTLLLPAVYSLHSTV